MLVELLCRGGDCPFYKSAEQGEADRRASFERRYGLHGPFTDFDKRYFKEEEK